MAQSIHHCPLCQGEISQRKSELLRSVVTQMRTIDAEQSATKEIGTQFSPEPESPLQVKLEPDEEEKLPGPSIPTPRVNHVKNHHREKPEEEEKQQYFCPAPGCPNVYKKLGTHLIKHALGKHGIKINPKNFSRGRKRHHLALEGERLSQIRKKFRPDSEDRQNSSVVLHPTLATRSFPWENKQPNRIVNEQEIITQSLTKEDGTMEVQYKCPWTNCKSVYRRIGQSLIRHAFEKHGIIIQAASPEGLYSCPAVGCRSFYRKYGASLFHHALEKHGIVLEDWLTKQGRQRKTSTLNDKGVKRKKEQELAAKMIAQAQQSPTSSNRLAAKMIAQAQQSPTSSNHLAAKMIAQAQQSPTSSIHSNHFSRVKDRNCPPWACGSCGLVFQDRSNMLEHVLYAHGRPHNPTIQLPALEAVPSDARNSISDSRGLQMKNSEQELLQRGEIKNERFAGELMSNGPKIPPFQQEEKHDPIHIEQSETESDSHPGNKGSSEEPNPSSAVQIRNLKQTPEVLDLKERPNSSFIGKQNPQYYLLKDSYLQNVDDRR